RVSFPFLSSSVVDVENNALPLWKRMVHPDHPGLLFIGLLQPVGPVMPLSEIQAKLAAKGILGHGEQPRRRDTVAQLAKHDRRNKKQFYSSPRHTMEVDFDHYLWEMEREMRRGAVAA